MFIIVTAWAKIVPRLAPLALEQVHAHICVVRIANFGMSTCAPSHMAIGIRHFNCCKLWPVPPLPSRHHSHRRDLAESDFRQLWQSRSGNPIAAQQLFQPEHADHRLHVGDFA